MGLLRGAVPAVGTGGVPCHYEVVKGGGPGPRTGPSSFVGHRSRGFGRRLFGSSHSQHASLKTPVLAAVERR